MIYLVLYLVTFILVGAVAWRAWDDDDDDNVLRAATTLFAGLIGPIVVVGAVLIIPIRVLAVKIGPLVDGIRKHMEDSND